ncbi:MAG: hypothetical protein OHK93_006315 [Ramalina farinacea]|uniref:Heterokaryon incompatibility domain-containing protein n=1 Tax=Ramalina farinacea TaxID=258253 RepID=A0AA43TWN1_9LECA|nr:hypothetical protein [Ramalina farinacea]
MLRDIYTKASEVLLIDSRLCRVSGSHAYETAIQFLCSEWLSRLWTFQEGYLARQLFIQFADKALSQETLVQDISKLRKRDWSGLASLLRLLLEREKGSETSSMSLFRWVLTKLQCRSTTVPADEAICLANILDVSNPDPTKLPSMEMIYQNISIPSGLLFLHGPRLKTPGLGWAPATFLNSDFDPHGLIEEVASLQEGGLRVTQCGILLHDTLKFREDDGILYWTLKLGKEHLGSEIPDDPNRLRQDQNIYFIAPPINTSLQLGGRQVHDPAIILNKDSRDGSIDGVLVSSAREIDGIWSCEFELTVDVWMPGKKYYDGMRNLCEAVNQFSGPNPCPGTYVENVQWLVG